jgi:hypothetical protein
MLEEMREEQGQMKTGLTVTVGGLGIGWARRV